MLDTAHHLRCIWYTRCFGSWLTSRFSHVSMLTDFVTFCFLDL